MRLYDSFGMNPRIVRFFMLEKGVELDREEVDEDELYRVLLNWPDRNALRGLGEVLFRPTLAEFRRDLRFMPLVNRAGLVAYWRSSGKWPDFCFETDFPYDCNKEGAKLDGRSVILPSPERGYPPEA